MIKKKTNQIKDYFDKKIKKLKKMSYTELKKEDKVEKDNSNEL